MYLYVEKNEKKIYLCLAKQTKFRRTFSGLIQFIGIMLHRLIFLGRGGSAARVVLFSIVNSIFRNVKCKRLKRNGTKCGGSVAHLVLFIFGVSYWI